MYALLALFSSLLWGSADFFGGRLARSLPPRVVVLATQTCGLILVLLVAVLVGSVTDDPGYLGWAVLAALAGTIGLVAFYAALAAGKVGVVSPVAALGVLVPLGVGLLRGDAPGRAQVVGIVLAVGGIVLASGPELSGGAGRRPLLLAVVSAAGFGVALLFIAYGSSHSAVMTLVTMRACSVLGLALLVGRAALVPFRGPVGWPRGAERAPATPARGLALIAAVGCGDVGANLAFGVASTHGLVSLTAVLGSLYPVATVLLARGLDHERLAAVQQAGVTAALAGVVLIGAG